MKNRLRNKFNVYQWIHSILILFVFFAVITYFNQSGFYRYENDLLSSFRFLFNLTLYKPLILSYSVSYDNAKDTYITLLYLIFICIYGNLYFATKSHKYLYISDEAFTKSDSFSGVLSLHLYSKLKPPIYSHGNYKMYQTNKPIKEFNNFLIEQWQIRKANNYFYFLFFLGFIALPFFCIKDIDSTATKLAGFWFEALLMIYIQTKAVFEILLIVRASIFNKE